MILPLSQVHEEIRELEVRDGNSCEKFFNPSKEGDMVKKIFPILFSTASLVLVVATLVIMSRARPGDEKHFLDLLLISTLCLLVGIYVLVKKDPW